MSRGPVSCGGAGILTGEQGQWQHSSTSSGGGRQQQPAMLRPGQQIPAGTQWCTGGTQAGA